MAAVNRTHITPHRTIVDISSPNTALRPVSGIAFRYVSTFPSGENAMRSGADIVTRVVDWARQASVE